MLDLYKSELLAIVGQEMKGLVEARLERLSFEMEKPKKPVVSKTPRIKIPLLILSLAPMASATTQKKSLPLAQKK